MVTLAKLEADTSGQDDLTLPPFLDLSSPVAKPVTNLTVRNSSFPWWRLSSSQLDYKFQQNLGRLFWRTEVLQKHITPGQENCFCCPCENMPGIWQVRKLNILYHCLDMLCKRSKKLIYPQSIHENRQLLVLVTRSAHWLRQMVSFTLWNIYFFLYVSYRKLAKLNPVTEGNARANQTWSGSPHNTH